MRTPEANVKQMLIEDALRHRSKAIENLDTIIELAVSYRKRLARNERTPTIEHLAHHAVVAGEAAEAFTALATFGYNFFGDIDLPDHEDRTTKMKAKTLPLTEVTKRVRQLNALLSEPQPGVSMWVATIYKQMNELVECWPAPESK